jgi:pimeloyl-ACP methyl ester carboxylesterase
MNDWIEQRPAEFLARLEAAAAKTETPCGDGTMVWRLWGDPASPVLALFHGGAGSWRHWAHNIDVLAQTYRLLVPDLPGLGESAFPPDGDDAMAVATIVASGIDRVLGADARYDVAGFSFGGAMATCVGAIHGARVRSVTIIGSSGVGPMGSAVELMKVRHLTGDERVEAHRLNLGRLMIADPDRIDELALAIQEWNTRHSRLKTPSLSRSGVLQQALAKVVAPVNGIWGGARCAGQSSGAATRRGTAGDAAGCGRADDRWRGALGGV